MKRLPTSGRNRKAARFDVFARWKIVICLSLALAIVECEGTIKPFAEDDRDSRDDLHPTRRSDGPRAAERPRGPKTSRFATSGDGSCRWNRLRGRVVVFQSHECHCHRRVSTRVDEVIDAYRDLGIVERQVEFVAVDVNRYSASTASVMSFTSEHGLDAVPTWHFVAGSRRSSSPYRRSCSRLHEVEASSPTAGASCARPQCISLTRTGGFATSR